MKNLSVAIVLVAFSLSAAAQEGGYDKRNLHIFCASHLALLSDSLSGKGDDYKALKFMSDTHEEQAKKLGATEKQLSDVDGYLKTVRNSNKGKWSRLTSRSREVCFPGS